MNFKSNLTFFFGISSFFKQVHPVQIVPYLICISTDTERVSLAADKQLQEIEKKYPGFIHMKSLHGIRLSFQLQSLIESSPKENSPSRHQSAASTKSVVVASLWLFISISIVLTSFSLK